MRAAVAIAGLLVFAPVARGEDVLRPGVKLWVDPQSSTYAHARELGGTDRVNALKLARVPGATWLTGGDARREAADVTRRAARGRAVPVIVAYDIPGRDCGAYSAGGAAGTRAYERWIDGLA